MPGFRDGIRFNYWPSSIRVLAGDARGGGAAPEAEITAGRYPARCMASRLG